MYPRGHLFLNKCWCHLLSQFFFGRPNFNIWPAKFFLDVQIILDVQKNLDVQKKKLDDQKLKFGRPKKIWMSKFFLDSQKNLDVQKKLAVQENFVLNHFLVDRSMYSPISHFMCFYQKRKISKSLHSSYPKYINPRIQQRKPIAGE